jgi:hypothetical protein
MVGTAVALSGERRRLASSVAILKRARTSTADEDVPLFGLAGATDVAPLIPHQLIADRTDERRGRTRWERRDAAFKPLALDPADLTRLFDPVLRLNNLVVEFTNGSLRVLNGGARTRSPARRYRSREIGNAA